MSGFKFPFKILETTKLKKNKNTIFSLFFPFLLSLIIKQKVFLLGIEEARPGKSKDNPITMETYDPSLYQNQEDLTRGGDRYGSC